VLIVLGRYTVSSYAVFDLLYGFLLDFSNREVVLISRVNDSRYKSTATECFVAARNDFLWPAQPFTDHFVVERIGAGQVAPPIELH
jgi:hypothetical protein